MTELDDLLFLNRNRNYGAYLLRKNYSRNMTTGLVISVLIFLIIVIVPSIDWEKEGTVYKMTEVVLETPPEVSMPALKSNSSISKNEKTPDEVKPEKAMKSGVKPKVIKEEEHEPVATRDTLTTDSSKSVSGNPTAHQDSVKGVADTGGEGDLTFDFADVMPQFPGGQKSLVRFIQSKLVYPGSAFQNRIEGIVIVGFIIDKNGRLREPKILKSLYPACDEEALRVVKLIPDWVPAKNQGRNVSINFTMPIEFRLKH